jgi:hypothetical protein
MKPSIMIDDSLSLNGRVKIDRKIYNFADFINDYPKIDQSTKHDLKSKLCLSTKKCQPSLKCVKNTLEKRVPAIKWLSKYKLKDYLLSDILSGIIVATVHVPQSMSYALLATVSPVYGLYTSFFPVLVYWIFGKHYNVRSDDQI